MVVGIPQNRERWKGLMTVTTVTMPAVCRGASVGTETSLGNAIAIFAVLAYGLKAHEGYYEDSVNLLSLLVLTGKAGLP